MEKPISPALQKLRDQMSQLKAKEQALLNRERVKERKERTRRLIQIGALAEKYLAVATPEDAEILFAKLAEKNPAN